MQKNILIILSNRIVAISVAVYLKRDSLLFVPLCPMWFHATSHATAPNGNSLRISYTFHFYQGRMCNELCLSLARDAFEEDHLGLLIPTSFTLIEWDVMMSLIAF